MPPRTDIENPSGARDRTSNSGRTPVKNKTYNKFFDPKTPTAKEKKLLTQLKRLLTHAATQPMERTINQNDNNINKIIILIILIR